MYMNKEKIRKNILSKLNQHEVKFLNQLEHDVYQAICNRNRTECLTIVMRDSNGKIISKYKPSEIINGYLPRLGAFLLKKKYNGLYPDSYLTDKIVPIVTNCITKFYTDEKNGVSDTIVKELLADEIFAKSFSDLVVERLGSTLPTAIRKMISQVIIENIHNTIGDNIIKSATNTITNVTTQIVSSVAALHVSKAMVAVILKQLTIVLKGVIAKVLASTAIKSIMVTAAKKYIAVALMTQLIAIIGSKLGISISASTVMWFIIPLLAIFIGKEIYDLPIKLAKKVSKKVRDEFSGEYKKLNDRIVENTISFITYQGLNITVGNVVNNDDIKEMFGEVAKAIQYDNSNG